MHIGYVKIQPPKVVVMSPFKKQPKTWAKTKECVQWNHIPKTKIHNSQTNPLLSPPSKFNSSFWFHFNYNSAKLHFHRSTLHTHNKPMDRSFLYNQFAPLAGMIAAECATVGSNTVYKAISGHEISFYVFTFYTCLAAALVLLPFALIFRRYSILPIRSDSFVVRWRILP